MVAALILRSTEPVIKAKYFTVQCTGEYQDRCVLPSSMQQAQEATYTHLTRMHTCRCYGFQAVYRISFVDFFFYLALAVGSKFTVVRDVVMI